MAEESKGGEAVPGLALGGGAAGGAGGDLPQTTPRRRLADALAMDAAIGDSDVGASTTETVAEDTAEMIHRLGKKVDGKYALVTGFLRAEKCRLDVYFQESSMKASLLVTYPSSLSSHTDADKRAAIKELVDHLAIDASGKITLGSAVAAMWVAL
mmetsp:Transcript_116681/g.283040  ORF Transcript_116681/g.283040 Transcript_116681/m.283040 type:complete len:155 (+) Transcript_116681:91-555(+)